MAAYEAGAETVSLKSEVGGNEGKDIQREAIDRGERVLPLVDGCQRRRDVMIKLRDLITGNAAKDVSAYWVGAFS